MRADRDAVARRGLRCAGNGGRTLRAFASGGVYVNGLSHDDAGRVRAAYGANYERRTAHKKQQYEPDNLFRLNFNITPAP
jgi:hypothetical protein